MTAIMPLKTGDGVDGHGPRIALRLAAFPSRLLRARLLLAPHRDPVTRANRTQTRVFLFTFNAPDGENYTATPSLMFPPSASLQAKLGLFFFSLTRNAKLGARDVVFIWPADLGGCAVGLTAIVKKGMKDAVWVVTRGFVTKKRIRNVFTAF